ncbi:MAG: NAD(P)-binding domain-containing protein [Anaerolineae bacterium]|nr:NAD(P)-binding domain-containing protein [Anaerolineae bacterium]
MTMVYHDEDGNVDYLRGKRVGVIGYGNMGSPMALNLRDSGVDVILHEPRAERREQALADGFMPVAIAELVAAADIIMPLLRDEAMPKIYLEGVSPHLRRGQTLIFSSAYNLTFGFIEAPPFVDVGLVAARTHGAAVRDRYLSGEGYASFVAVAQDASRSAWPTILAVAKAAGALKVGAIETRFEQETELDLFLQQAVLPVLHQVVITAAELLMKLGYPPEAVFTELYLSGETSDYLRAAASQGLLKALDSQSLTAQYGILSRYERFNDLKLERLMEITLEEIRSSKFAQEWSKEFNADYPRLRNLLKSRRAMDMWELEQQTIDALQRDGD